MPWLQGCCWPALGEGRWWKEKHPSPCQLMGLGLVCLPTPAEPASAPESSCTNTQSSCSPTPSCFLSEVSRVPIILMHLLLPQMTLEMRKMGLCRQSEDWDNQVEYSHLISCSSRLTIVLLFSFWSNFSIITQKPRKQIGNTKVLLTQLQLQGFQFPFGELWSSSSVSVQNWSIKIIKAFAG